ncbi:helix-turn-helix domain-containing protein [Streptomyces sp. NPDC001262]|uniref:helix-turn-helix domain-containing protein n=1 Tax=Streptomyces sp. NPDC001262 TaxID=3364552 RepID=UPI0036C51B2D
MTTLAPEKGQTSSQASAALPLGGADSPLAAARRARGLSIKNAARAMALLAEQWGWTIAAEQSLVGYLRRWEHEENRPRETYRRLLCAIYGVTPEQLGFVETGAEPEAAALEAAERLDAGPEPLMSPLGGADSPLAAARRARGYSLTKAARALLLTAQAWGWNVAAEQSVVQYLHRWEHGETRPGSAYQVLLCAIYRSTPEQLGFTEPRPGPESDGLRAQVTALESVVQQLTAAMVSLRGGTAAPLPAAISSRG